jgi:Bacterial regulatory protein, Fis family
MALNRFGYTLAEVEREHILETLTCCDGNRSRAARLLNISVRCLRMKLHQFGQSRAKLPPSNRSARPDHLSELVCSATLQISKQLGEPASKAFPSRMCAQEAERLWALRRPTKAADLFAPSVRQRIGETIAKATRVSPIKFGPAVTDRSSAFA